jgi:hypothetical protein
VISDALYAASTLANASTTLGPWLSHNIYGILQVLVFVVCFTFIIVLQIKKHPDGKRFADASSRLFTGRYTKYIVIIVMSLSMILSIFKLLHVLFAKE